MERRPIKRTVNKIHDIKEEEPLAMITPETDVTNMPYQGFISNQEYYTRMQSSCFELDSAISEIVSKKFTGNNIRNMTDEDAIKAYKALEKSKMDRSKMFLDLATRMSDNDFFRKQQEIDRLKAYHKNNIIDAQVVVDKEDEPQKTPEEEKLAQVERNKQQQVLKLLQMAVMDKLENNKDEPTD